jgi:DNA gyrase/topoisomerase IV subunit B
VYEILDNSIDEVQAGHATNIRVSATLHLLHGSEPPTRGYPIPQMMATIVQTLESL